MNKRTASIFFISAAGFVCTASSAFAQGPADSAATFSSKCASCHTIGGGKLVGPDLAGVKGWPDADLTKTVERMQGMAGPLSPDEIKGLVGFLKSANAQADLKAKQEEIKAKAAIAEDKEPASATTGRDLFTGKTSLQNGGMSCISCHSSSGGGGTVGLDLTNVAERMTGAALISACETAPFPVMKAAYAKHPITHQEARNLAKYFESTKDIKTTERKFEPTWLAGSAIALVTLAAIGFGYRNRNDSVNKKLRRR